MNETKKKYEHILHPYIFMLKEGKQIGDNLMDYSLLLLQVGDPDILRSPKKKQKNPLPTAST